MDERVGIVQHQRFAKPHQAPIVGPSSTRYFFQRGGGGLSICLVEKNDVEWFLAQKRPMLGVNFQIYRLASEEELRRWRSGSK